MKKIFIFSLLIFLLIGSVFAGNSDIIVQEAQYILSDSDYQDITYATEGGDSNINFANGYKGYCVEYMEKSAEINDNFYVTNTSYIVNKEDEDVGNYIKTFFVYFYNNTTHNNFIYQNNPINQDIYNQHIIWHFTDNFESPITVQEKNLINDIKEKSQETVLPDDGYIQYNETSNMIYSFRGLISDLTEHQNYFGYKIGFEDIQNCHNNINNTTINNVINNITNINNTTINNNIINIDNTTINNITNIDNTTINNITNIDNTTINNITNIDNTTINNITNIDNTTINNITNIDNITVNNITNIDNTTINNITNINNTTNNIVIYNKTINITNITIINNSDANNVVNNDTNNTTTLVVIKIIIYKIYQHCEALQTSLHQIISQNYYILLSDYQTGNTLLYLISALWLLILTLLYIKYK